MAARLTHDDRARILRMDLRCKTAAVLHTVYAGVVKMVAANRPPNGVSRQRVEEETSGSAANRLELICQDLDRVVIEKGTDGVLPAVAFLNERYSSRNGDEQPGVLVSFTRAVVEGGEAEAALITALSDGSLAGDRPRLLVELRQWRDRVDSLICAVEHEKELPPEHGAPC